MSEESAFIRFGNSLIADLKRKGLIPHDLPIRVRVVTEAERTVRLQREARNPFAGPFLHPTGDRE